MTEPESYITNGSTNSKCPVSLPVSRPFWSMLRLSRETQLASDETLATRHAEIATARTNEEVFQNFGCTRTLQEEGYCFRCCWRIVLSRLLQSPLPWACILRYQLLLRYVLPLLLPCAACSFENVTSSTAILG